MSGDREITLRPVTDADDDFILSVYASTRADEMALVPWGPEQKDTFVRMQFQAQKQHYAAEYPRAEHDVICSGGSPVGRLYLDCSGDALHILDITVLPQHRNAGIGTELLRRILNQGAQEGKPVTIFVENFNRSLRLLERLGFQRAEEKGFQLLMRGEGRQSRSSF